MSQVKAIIGLGNPGADYEATRHNAGAWLVEAVARRAGGELRPDRKFLGLYARVQFEGHDLHLLNPTTFMNRSGGAVAALCQFYKIAPDELLVAHDELDIAPGTARYKTGGGHGGHNGLRDIISKHGNQKEFVRLRIGIGHPGSADLVTPHVLGRPAQGDRILIERAIDEALRYTGEIVRGDLARAMNGINSYKSA